MFNSLDRLLIFERPHSLEVFFLDGRSKLKHLLPLVSVAEETKAMEGHTFTEKDLAFDEELRG